MVRTGRWFTHRPTHCGAPATTGHMRRNQHPSFGSEILPLSNSRCAMKAVEGYCVPTAYDTHCNLSTQAIIPSHAGAINATHGNAAHNSFTSHTLCWYVPCMHRHARLLSSFMTLPCEQQQSLSGNFVISNDRSLHSTPVLDIANRMARRPQRGTPSCGRCQQCHTGTTRQPR